MISTAAPAAPPLPKIPYRGIEPFRYVDQQIFFVRQEETQSLLQYISLYRGVLLYGASGTGKSSLINAGLIPAVLAEGFTPDKLRVQPRAGEEIIIERIPVNTDGKPPYLRSNFQPDDDKSPRAVLSIRAFINSVKAVGPGPRPLLIFDQFEEFVTLFEEALTGSAAREARRVQESLLEMLVGLMREHSLRVKILLVFREDYLAKLSRLFSLCPNLPDQHLRLLPPRVDTLPKIIRGPFDSFPGHFARELSEDLAEKLAAAVAKQSDSGALNLSEVQIACLRLWQSRNPDELFGAMSLNGLLEDYSGASLYRLEAVLRDPARALLSRMVTASGTRNVISGEDLVSLVHNDEHIPEALLKEALDALEGETKLVRRERRHDTYFYEIVSECLIPWISRQREERTQERLADIERRKRHKAYWVAGALAVVALTLFIIVFDRVRQNSRATELSQRVRELESEMQRQRIETLTIEGRLKEAQEATKDADSQFKGEQQAALASDAVSELLYQDAGVDRRNLLVTINNAASSNPTETATPPPLVATARSAISISYGDGPSSVDSAEECWSQFGYDLRASPYDFVYSPVKIYCGSRVSNEDLMKVALCLVKSRMEIVKRIEPLPPGQGPTDIRVRLAESDSASPSTYSVNELQSLGSGHICAGR